jgi:hypothetical protein
VESVLARVVVSEDGKNDPQNELTQRSATSLSAVDGVGLKMRMSGFFELKSSASRHQAVLSHKNPIETDSFP